MKLKKLFYILIPVLLLAGLLAGMALAEDGVLFRRNVSKTPEGETEKSAIYMMDFYVPAQAADGTVGPVDNYIAADDMTVAYESRDFAKPLVTVYIDDIGGAEEAMPEGMVSIQGGITFGEFDAFAGISLDDGTTWKTTNLSRSADLSSFNLSNGKAYPGDVHNVVHQVAGDRIFIAWASKYCEGGTPLYSLDPTEDADYFGDLETTYGKDAVYLYDLFGVAGSQGSVDYTLQGFPEIGEIPYSCIWTARGKLLAGDDPSTTDAVEASYVMWAKPERLTSGKRDANLPAVDCAKDAGCILTWQEDPEGLRPGQGLGPGEGWSGAIANAQTDIWYSFISYTDFDDVLDAEMVEVVPMEGYLGDTMPKPYVPMAIPTRLTDNAKCKGVNTLLNPSDPYCYIDFDTIDGINHENVDALLELTAPDPDADYCATTINWTTPGGTTQPVCVTENGRVLNGRVASTRVRLNLKPYTPADAVDLDDDGLLEKSAWVVMAAEETKALGDILVDPYGNPTEEPIDIGKDVWYYSFDMFDHVIVDQGGMLNQPAICNPWTVGADYECTPYEFFPVQTDPLNGGDYYLTEIARRFALTTNSVQAAMDSQSGLSAMLIYKQGIINQGGPADIFLRRVVIPEVFDETVDNPYAYENMECVDDPENPNDGWVYTDENNGGINPNYLKGLCLSPAINISGNTIERCDGGSDNDTCAAAFPVADDGSIPTTDLDFPKVYEWRQCDGISAIEGCEDDSDLDDQSWENPFDVAKGHRGFLDGDIVMMMYAWAPNWKSNTVGNDHYNLYVRRSFDGGLTWTTTPADLGGAEITVTENYYGDTIGQVAPMEWPYGAGDFEQGRNVSLLIGNKITILDPRYTPSGGLKLYSTIRTDWLTDNGISFEGLPYEDDLARDPGVYFMVYETGDNTTVAEGEAIPLDLYYSRATVYGDIYEVMDYITDKDDLLLDRWPWLENKSDDLSGEAGVVANPGGTFMYAVWNQWKEEIGEDGHELVYDSDMIFRRLMYSTEDAYPVATILLAPTVLGYNTDSDVTFVGTARDNDQLGDGRILDYVWTSDLDGLLSNEKSFTIPTTTLDPGFHIITFTAQDEEGNWSREVTVKVLVAEVLTKLHLPLIQH